MKQIRRAVIPAAGLGTRSLPASKSVPKELLAVIDKPLLLFVVEEAVAAGIDEIIIVTSKGKGALREFFNPSSSHSALQSLHDTLQKIRVEFVEQERPLGLGHAVSCARGAVGQQPFAVLLPDEIFVAEGGKKSPTHELIALYEKTKTSIVSIMEVPKADVSKYGIVDAAKTDDNLYQIKNVIEKPQVEKAPTNLALPGRYVFSPQIFNYLESARPGTNGEIQLTDAMSALAKNEGLLGTKFDCLRFDAGDKADYFRLIVHAALKHPEIAEKAKNVLLKAAEKIKNEKI